MPIELAEHDITHGTHGNPRAWLEAAVAATLQHGYQVVLSGEGRKQFLAHMAKAGLGDYCEATPAEQDHVIIACIDTALLFMV